MKRLIGASLLAVATSLSVVSCGGEADLNAAGGTIDAAALTSIINAGALNQFKALIEPTGTGNVTLPTGIALPTGVGSLANPYDGCKTEQGSSTDGADNDGIPEFFRQDFNCSAVVNGHNGTDTFVGHYEVKDFDDTKYGIAGGYAFDFDMTYENSYPHEVNVGRWGGIWSVTVAGTTITTANKYYFEGGSTPTATPDKKSVWRASNNFTHVIKADDATMPWQKGSASMEGFYGFSGVIYDNATQISHKLEVVFEIATDSLTYDRAACNPKHYKDGSISFTDGGGNVLKYTFVNCSETRTFNGQTI